jgi:hypothetical protein
MRRTPVVTGADADADATMGDTVTGAALALGAETALGDGSARGPLSGAPPDDDAAVRACGADLVATMTPPTTPARARAPTIIAIVRPEPRLTLARNSACPVEERSVPVLPYATAGAGALG